MYSPSNSNQFLVLPGHYSYTLRDPGLLYEGSVFGYCAVHYSSDGHNVVCYEPTTSVLFDGRTPTLTELDGYMWASELFVNSLGSFRADFTHIPGYIGVRRVEIVMFNCPERGIGAEQVSLGDISRSPITSCGSLVRVCISCYPICRDLILELNFSQAYLAEVEFYDNDPTCPQDTIELDNSYDRYGDYSYDDVNVTLILVIIGSTLSFIIICRLSSSSFMYILARW